MVMLVSATIRSASSQAPDFPNRLRYEEFGRIEDFLPGHCSVWLKKGSVHKSIACLPVAQP
ncbi:hypothetical protein [Aminobacter sp. AP02]|uniref:hypothetical protein n=1 Tax=Aminobacter sp. AP02 TaxID=2135737 RepID=UPI0011B280F0|nr:hypothetical protein [Aminobacter sp. AP02]